jgi:hypothetical protein
VGTAWWIEKLVTLEWSYPYCSVLDSGPAGDSDGGGSVTAEPQEPYVRVDAQLQRTFSGRIRSFDFDFTPYLKVINALNRRDAIFYHYNRDVGYAEPVAGLPIVPIVGLEWKF